MESSFSSVTKARARAFSIACKKQYFLVRYAGFKEETFDYGPNESTIKQDISWQKSS
jgi:hypothetical protein